MKDLRGRGWNVGKITAGDLGQKGGGSSCPTSIPSLLHSPSLGRA